MAKGKAKPKTGRGSGVKTPLPEPFEITEDLRSWFRGEFGEVPRGVVMKEHEHFLDRQRAIGAKYVDWKATWRNWMRKAANDYRDPLGAWMREHRRGNPPPRQREYLSNDGPFATT